MNKRPSLAERMREAATPPEPERAEAIQPKPVQSFDGTRRFYAATRVGKKKVTATLLPSDHKRLRQLALENETTTQSLLAEAISDLFAKYQGDQRRAGRGTR